MKHTIHYQIYCFLLAFFLAGCSKDNPSPEEKYSHFVLGGFSPDGSKLALSFCTTRSICKTGLFDLIQKKFSEITLVDSDHFYIPGGFSPDGAFLAMTVRRNTDKGQHTQIAVFELTTEKLTEITNSHGYRSSPSFSHDGKKLIFAQANRERESGKTRFSDWDIYEIDFVDMNERRLTAFEFYSVTPPSYLPGDTKFIFSGEGPHAYVSPSGEKGYKAYKARFQDNSIFLLPSSGSQQLKPIFIKDDFSSYPVISHDGSQLVYTAMTHRLDSVRDGFTYDLFLFDGKKHKRLTKLNSLINDISMSSDGGHIGIVIQPRERLITRELKLLDINNGLIQPLDPANLFGRDAVTQ